MKIKNTKIVPLLALLLAVSLHSCKSKKVAQQPASQPVATEEPAPQPSAPAASPAQPTKEEPAPAPAPNYNFSTIQFEFDSAVLKTFSYKALDEMAREMKKDNAAKFIINGHSSAEGTPEHNKTLSLNRANAVKQYLVNSGVGAQNLESVGHGETKPLVSNNTEEGRAKNRRVDVKLSR